MVARWGRHKYHTHTHTYGQHSCALTFLTPPLTWSGLNLICFSFAWQLMLSCVTPEFGPAHMQIFSPHSAPPVWTLLTGEVNIKIFQASISAKVFKIKKSICWAESNRSKYSRKCRDFNRWQAWFLAHCFLYRLNQISYWNYMYRHPCLQISTCYGWFACYGVRP